MAIRIVFFSDTHLGFDYPVRGVRKTRGVRKAGERRRRGADFFDNFERVLRYARGFTSCRTAQCVVWSGKAERSAALSPNTVRSPASKWCLPAAHGPAAFATTQASPYRN